jgi:repressor LexA
MAFKENLRKAREMAGVSQAKLAGMLSITQSAVTHWENGSRQPDIETINKLADIFGVSIDFLIGTTTVPDGVVVPKVTVMQSKIHVYGRIPAGVPFEAIQDILEDVEVPSWLAEKKGLFGLKVVGDSMNKVIPDGAIAVLQKTHHLENGDIGAVMVNGYDATLKKFFRLTDSVVLEPLSFNPEHEPIVIKDGTTEVQTIGKLVWFCAAQEW